MKKITIIVFFFSLIKKNFIFSKDPESSLEKITEFRQQHRKTLDGRLCAAAFLHDDQTYTDCTDATSPDGTSGKEWCYVEVQLLGKGSRDWDYCANAINYDKLRMHAKKVFEEKSLEADRLKDRLQVLNSRIHSMLQKFDSVCGKKHELINSRIEKINEWLTKSEDSLSKIENNSNDIDSTKKIIDKLQIDIKNENESAKQAEENCENSPGYEDEPRSDGLKVSYFNNPIFEGSPIETRIEKDINFFYSNRGPLESLSPYKYSIRYEGFLLAPHNGTYIFAIETDCSVRLLLNNKVVLMHGFEEIEENSFSIRSMKYSIVNDDKSEIIKKNSKPIELIGGEKHKFVLEVSHSSHLKYKNGESASFKLLWKSSAIDEEVIQSHYFFSENIIPPTRFSSLNAELFEIGLTDIGEYIFKNDTDWLITSIPSKYIGLHLIRTEPNPQFTNFSLSINTGSNLFIAAPENEILPLSPYKDSLWKAFNTEDILEVTHSVTKEKKKFKIKFIPLKNRAELKFHVLNNIPFLIFAQQRKILPTICNGEEEVLSSPENSVFKECIESSALTEEFNCLAGLQNLHIDKKYSMWRSSNASIGEYIKVFFNRPVQINKFRFKPRDDILTWPSEISLLFDDTELIVPILHTSNMDHNTFKLEHPIITTSVKIEIRDMFVNNDETGGSFELIGNSCNITDNDYMVHHAIIDIIDCNNTLNDIPDVLPLINGDKFLATCDYHCMEQLSGEVYGSDLYSTDSALCKTAVHAGVCKNQNKQNCKFLVMISNKQENYVGSLQNNILSLNQNKSSNLSFTISPAFIQNFSQLYSSSPNSYSIVFKRNYDLNLPNKFLIDSGEVFKDYGTFAYGWNRPVNLLEPLIQKNIYSNSLFSGGINFPPASASEHCITDLECQTNFWKFKTHENGTYTIQVLIGNISSNDKQNAFIEVNGLPLIKNVELQKNEYFVAVKNVQITNRSLIFTSTCLESENECTHAKTTIMAIQILKT
ncbi:LCCL domain-containing protein, putative [Plasmodium gallinaceum]|uniref:LCCL domain-containing protein, putative n=1 Tax=Plasmodium gallinaceum TaxID=5849 RepID=A0A1J1GLN9_PLAGA|nr:LCCL domain-containing protein, putative [Plasmodium gallinaceum]CRG93344.1 LCCL domain-containing protein, putative [Plasmodium gallinaceum]